MATSQMCEVIQHLRRAMLLRDGAGLTDGQLLEDYISRRDEAALAALVRRHGPMVWGVCRRVLHHYHDAEDAFQATFLVLVRKAASITSRELLANWLYGVAHQTALKARATAARRKERERQVTQMPEPAVSEQDLWRDLQPLLDDELRRLPDKYRAVLVLCDLEGKTRREVAQQLGRPEGTVAGRLARARAMLAKRLAQRGVALSGAVLAVVLSRKVASAGVPTSVVSSTIRAVSLLAARQAAASGVISAKVAALTEGVLKTMLITKLKSLTVATLAVVAFVAIAAGLLGSRTAAAGQDEKKEIPVAPQQKDVKSDSPKEGKEKEDATKKNLTVHALLEDVDAKNNTITVADVTKTMRLWQLVAKPKLTPKENKEAWELDAFLSSLTDEGKVRKQTKLVNLPLANDAKITGDGKEIKVSDLKAGKVFTLHLTATPQRGLEVVSIQKYRLP
jgi:RNA polymerase sigma factor (sigma-70 family)